MTWIIQSIAEHPVAFWSVVCLSAFIGGAASSIYQRLSS